MGFMDTNEQYLYHADFGTTGIRIINRETFDENVIETGIMTHQIKLIFNYLFVVDMNNFYVFDIDKKQIIATYQTNGEVTALCRGNPKRENIYGFTTKGQLFRINMGLHENMVRPFLEKERVFSICS